MNKTNKQLICEAIGFDDLKYGQMVYDYANAWMQRYFCANDIMIQALENSQSFWTWWKRQWELRDERFIALTNLKDIETPLEGDFKTMALHLYHEEHNVYQLKIFPDKVVRLEAGREIIKQYEIIKSLK